MKNKDRIRMLLHPEQYTDEQLDQMLDETNVAVPDVEEEWLQFKTKRQHHRRPNPVMRWAAIIVTMVALSGITYAAIQHFRKANDAKEETTTVAHQPEQKVEQQEAEHNVATAVERNDSTRKDQQFNNVQLQQIMQQLCRDYGVKVVFKNETSRTLRFYLKWEANDSIQDIIKRINHFEKVHLTLSGETVTIE
jgi:hypothetical protein